MKVDHFAEFRHSHIENAGNAGTTAESSRKVNVFFSEDSVPHDLANRGTGEQTCAGEPDPSRRGDAARESVPQVPQRLREAGNKPKQPKSALDQFGFESVPPVPHVPPERKDGGEKVPTRNVVPDSRYPLIHDAIRAKLEAVEAEARAKGWPAELLWNAGFWDLPRGLAAVLDVNDEITEVTPDYIEILKTRRHLLKFRRHNT